MAVNVTTKEALPKFPVERERQEFPNWMFKVESFLAARHLLEVIKKPVVNKESNDTIVGTDEDEENVFLGVNTSVAEYQALVDKSMRAYDYIVQSLHTKQVDLIRGVATGNAYMVMKKLRKSYDLIKSTTTTMTLLSKLNTNRKFPAETMNDYFARIDRIISDLRVLDAAIVRDSFKKYFILNGLVNDAEYSLIVSLIYQLDVDSSWSVEKLEQFLLDQEDKKAIQKLAKTHVDINDVVPVVDETKALSSQQSYRGNNRGRRGRFSYRGRGRISNNSDRPNSSSLSTSHDNDSLNNSSSQRSYRGRGSFRGGFRGRGRFQQSKTSNMRCYTCNRIGHTSSQCRNNPLANMQCHTCQRYGHISSSCFQNQRKRNSDDTDTSNEYGSSYTSSSTSTSLPLTNSVQDNKKQRQTLAYVTFSNSSSATSSALNSLSSLSQEWILDGGATDHYVCDANMLHDIVALTKPRMIVTANGSSSCITIGKVTIRIDAHTSIVLNDVLYAPDFRVNLISVFRITRTGAHVIFTDREARVTSGDQVQIVFPCRHNLYVLSPFSSLTTHGVSSPLVSCETPSSSSSSSFRSEAVPVAAIPSSTSNSERVAKAIFQLHLKYGHVNYQRLIQMIKRGCVMNIELFSKRHRVNEREVLRYLNAQPCEGCLKGKMSRLAMTKTIEYYVNNCMDMWVFDTMIISIPTMSGCWNISLTMDVYATKLFVGLHRTKDEIAPFVINLIKREQTQLGLTVKRLHSDNGTEIKNDTVKLFLDSQGTIHTTCTAYTPQHNAIIERKNRTVIEMVRAMLHHADAEPRLYGEATVAAVHILNMTVNVHHPSITPYELWYHRKPDASHLHVWGCDVHYHHHKQKRENKFDANSKLGIFVGYVPHNATYYRIYDVDDFTITISRDVIFHEDRFTEMKRLKERMNDDHLDDANHDLSILKTTRMTIDDYLPDSLFKVKYAVADMFNSEGASKKRKTNDNIVSSSAAARPADGVR